MCITSATVLCPLRQHRTLTFARLAEPGPACAAEFNAPGAEDGAVLDAAVALLQAVPGIANVGIASCAYEPG